jgi:hypothetical protein
MKKVFVQETINNNYEVRIFNMESGEFSHYYQDKNIGFTFSEYTTTAADMGYKSINDCLKQLKHRFDLGQEVDYQEQLRSEKIGWINLGVERIKRNKRVNTRDFEDIIQKLSKYGLGYCDAQNQIIATYEYSLN